MLVLSAGVSSSSVTSRHVSDKATFFFFFAALNTFYFFRITNITSLKIIYDIIALTLTETYGNKTRGLEGAFSEV